MCRIQAGEKGGNLSVNEGFHIAKGKETTDTTAPALKWDDSNMSTYYPEVCNILSTREEVTLLFGTKETWHADPGDLTVRLADRIFLSPQEASLL